MTGEHLFLVLFNIFQHLVIFAIKYYILPILVSFKELICKIN